MTKLSDIADFRDAPDRAEYLKGLSSDMLAELCGLLFSRRQMWDARRGDGSDLRFAFVAVLVIGYALWALSQVILQVESNFVVGGLILGALYMLLTGGVVLWDVAEQMAAHWQYWRLDSLYTEASDARRARLNHLHDILDDWTEDNPERHSRLLGEIRVLSRAN